MISYDEFKKVEIKAGKILSAEKVLNADKLLRLMVDFDEKVGVAADLLAAGGVTNADEAASVTAPAPQILQSKPRQIISGISMYFPDPATLVGKTCMFVTNLEPRIIRGLESNGMILAVSTPERLDEKGVAIPGSSSFSLLEPNSSIPPGTYAK
jgi:methionyl-tRNA synthetase